MTNKEAIERLKQMEIDANRNTMGHISMDGRHKEIEMAIKSLEEQDKHRWIPVSDGLPPEHDTMFAKFKGTSKWTNSMFEKMSDDVNVTIELEDGTRKTTTMHTTDGEWLFGFDIVKKKVIAWTPLPEVYKQVY